MGVGSSRGDAAGSLWFEEEGPRHQFFRRSKLPREFFCAKRWSCVPETVGKRPTYGSLVRWKWGHSKGGQGIDH